MRKELVKIIIGCLLLQLFNYAFAEIDRTIIKTGPMQVTENLRLRQTESTSSEILTTLKTDSAVEVVKIGKPDVIDGIKSNWVKIKLLPGSRGVDGNFICLEHYHNGGWCFGGYLKEPEDSSYWLLSNEECYSKLEEAVKEKSFEKLQAYTNYGNYCGWVRYYWEEYSPRIYNPVCMTIRYDWNEGFDWLKNNYPPLLKFESNGDGTKQGFGFDPIVDALYSGNNYYLQEVLKPKRQNFGDNYYWMVMSTKEEANELQLYEEPSETSACKIVKSDRQKSYYYVLEIGQKIYPDICSSYKTRPHGEASYFEMYRWIKIYDKVSGEKGWLKPGDSMWIYSYDSVKIQN